MVEDKNTNSGLTEEEIEDWEVWDEKQLEEYEEKMAKMWKEEKKQTVVNTSTTFESQHKSIQNTNVPRCPTCGSTNVEPISTTRKLTGVLMLGFASKSVGKSYRCKNCNYYW